MNATNSKLAESHTGASGTMSTHCTAQFLTHAGSVT